MGLIRIASGVISPLICFALFGCIADGLDRYEVMGQLVDAATEEPLAMVHVGADSVLDQAGKREPPQQVETDAHGHFKVTFLKGLNNIGLLLPPGPLEVVYLEVSVSGETVPFTLFPDAQAYKEVSAGIIQVDLGRLAVEH